MVVRIAVQTQQMRNGNEIDDALLTELCTLANHVLAARVGCKKLLDFIELILCEVDPELLTYFIKVAEAHEVRGAELLASSTVAIDLKDVSIYVLPLVGQLVRDHLLVVVRRQVVCVVGSAARVLRRVGHAGDLAPRNIVLLEIQTFVHSHEPGKLAVVNTASPRFRCPSRIYGGISHSRLARQRSIQRSVHALGSPRSSLDGRPIHALSVLDRIIVPVSCIWTLFEVRASLSATVALRVLSIATQFVVFVIMLVAAIIIMDPVVVDSLLPLGS